MAEKEKWRWIPYKQHDPYTNMAIDEAMLIAHSEGLVPPTIRFYGWNPATLSLGYFQRSLSEVNVSKVKEKGLGLVRRQTGGRAVLHDQELTYSVVVSEKAQGIPSTVTDSYRVLNQGLLYGFIRLGLDAQMVSLASEEEKRKYETLGSAACFDSPSWYELVVEGKKVAGSAQTRQRGVVLQHGAILLDIDVDLLFEVLCFPSDRVKERLKQGFSHKAVAINDLRRQKATVTEAQDAFYHGFSEGLGIELVQGELTPCEWEKAQELVRTKYSIDGWNFKR
jgi:lipoate-protein ligase A